MSPLITIALTGNPNSGKTTLFNQLTGARQHVGNYPGVTVEIKEGLCRSAAGAARVVDLPGIYSLTSYSPEEQVTRRFLLGDKPDAVVDVVDTSNLERHLYLAVQCMELGLPLVLAFNMSDVARARGLEFNLLRLSALFGVPIVPTSGTKGEGVPDLLTAALAVARRERPCAPAELRYGRDVEAALEQIQPRLSADGSPGQVSRARWLAVKLLENDADVWKEFPDPALRALVDRERAQLAERCGDTPEIIIADRRYGFISGACSECVRLTVEERHDRSDRIDALLIHRVWGLPIFLLLMYAVFFIVFKVGGPPTEWLDHLFATLKDLTRGGAPGAGSGLWRSLLADGVLGGVGGVLMFLPNIVMLFTAIAVLEDTGYMARAAFIMDRLMHKLGLHGQSFIPLLLGFGCSVPAIMATRTLESRRDRLTTMLIIPLMSCGARFPIYALIIPAFFPAAWQAPILWLIYLLGIVLAVLCARVLRRTLFRGETTPFVMELPPYRRPTVKGLALHAWDNARHFLHKAGTVVLVFSLVLWALASFPRAAQPAGGAVDRSATAPELAQSYAGRIGHALEPVIRPMGFDWRIGTAILGAFAAKEIFVAQMGVVFSVGHADESSEPLRARLRELYTPLNGLCIMIFMLIGLPCMATVAVTRTESGAWRWAALQFGLLTGLAYLITTLVYQAGRLAGF
ncbi:MAG: ferrous iron transport protein B [Kiritimatiellaeota bacterium]|nr:ferrous iron transport protein B [Kiritimatiellota bacterium]